MLTTAQCAVAFIGYLVAFLLLGVGGTATFTILALPWTIVLAAVYLWQGRRAR